MTEIFLAPDAVILIVEDEPIIAASIELFLNELGATDTHIARNSELAFEFLDRHLPSLALVDWQLREETSANLVSRLRELSVGIILVTGYSESQHIGQDWAGLVVLEKPFGEQALHDAIRKAMAENAAVREIK
jgi:DNA-binding response OmpR family regulator